MKFRHKEKGQDFMHRRALLKAIGYREKDLDSPPWIAVVHGWSEVSPGQSHLKEIADKVKAGIYAKGGTPAELIIPGICGSISGGAPEFRFNVPYRDFASALLESFLRLAQFDGAVLIPTCDNVIPAYLMTAARIDIPSIMVTGGYMSPGVYQGKMIMTHDTMRGIVKVMKGEITEKEFYNICEAACPTPGACPVMGTAHTMAGITEALGMSLPTNASLPAVADARLKRLAREAGERVVELIEEDIRPSTIMKYESFLNAIKLVQSVGGSTNAIIHIAAIARELGIIIDLKIWDSIGRSIPFIGSITPNRIQYTMKDFDLAGGFHAVMKQLLPLLDGDLLTVNGKTIAENVKNSEIYDNNIIRSLDQPFANQGGLAILYGNLALEGAVIKISAIDKSLNKVKGPALVFDSEESAIEEVLAGKVKPGEIIIVRYEGPRGSPGGLELMKLKHHMTMLGMDKHNVVITDGRFSGGNYGMGICHVAPEAMEGGPIAVVKNGDEIQIDIEDRSLRINIEDNILNERLKDWKAPQPKVKSGALALYGKLSSSFAEGASIFSNFYK